MLYSLLLGSRMSAFFAVVTVQKHAKQQNNHTKRLIHLLSIDVGHLGSQFEAKGNGKTPHASVGFSSGAEAGGPSPSVLIYPESSIEYPASLCLGNRVHFLSSRRVEAKLRSFPSGNGPFSAERRSPRVSACLSRQEAGRRTYMYASAKTLVRPTSAKKFLISELKT